MKQSIDRKTIIRERLMQALNPTCLDIEDQSHMHVGHAGAKNGAGHYAVYIESSAFEGKNEIQRHRMVYAALNDLIPNEIHALAIQTNLPTDN